jgi:hypothetical protein
MTYEELIELCSQYDDGCEVYVYMFFTLEHQWKNLSLENFGGERATTRQQFDKLRTFASEIKHVTIRPEMRVIPWTEITNVPKV